MNESPAPAAAIAITGTTGNDVLKGTQFTDALTGNAGNLYSDPDGSGAGAKVEIVSLTGIPVLTAADFAII